MMLYLCSTVITVQVIKSYCSQKIQCFVICQLDKRQNVKLLHLALVITATLDRPLLFRLRRIFLHLRHISIPISLFCAQAHLQLRLHLHTCTCYYTYGRRWFECTRFWDKKAPWCRLLHSLLHHNHTIPALAHRKKLQVRIQFLSLKQYWSQVCLAKFQLSVFTYFLPEQKKFQEL